MQTTGYWASRHLERDMAMAGVQLDVRVVEKPEDGVFEFGCVDIWCPVDVDMDQIEMGEVCCEAGRAAAEWVIRAVDLAMADRIDGIVTAPLNKEAMKSGGFIPLRGIRNCWLRNRAQVAHISCWYLSA